LKRFALLSVFAVMTVFWVSGAGAGTPGEDVRLTNDCLTVADDPLGPAPEPPCAGGGYISAYALAGSPDGPVAPDPVISECSISRGRQNEPAVEIDPRNPDVLIGSSNDYCAVFAPELAATLGPVWMGYYRSEDGGSSFQSSLVPGYPQDNTPFAELAHVRTANAGDPVIAWDNHGRVFLGAESSGDPEGSAKTLGDVWVARYANPDGPLGDTINDGKLYQGSETVARGSSAPNLLGKFNDKTAIEADRTGGACDGNVYFSWARFTGGPTNGFNSFVYFVRSTNHGVSFTKPMKLSQTIHDIQNPDISVTGNGHVYVTFRQFASAIGSQFQDAVWYVKSTDCGQTFSQPKLVTTFEPSDPSDITDGGDRVIDCGDAAGHCQSGYTFPRRTTQVRATADQSDHENEWVYIVYDPSIPGTEEPTGTTYGTIVSGDLPLKYHKRIGAQAGVYFTRLDGTTGTPTEPKQIDPQLSGHQFFPDISATNGVLHAIWWDSRLDPSYSVTRPVGNRADGSTVASLDTFGATSTNVGLSWIGHSRVSDVSSNPNYEQFGGRTVPFAGDYLWVTSFGEFSYGVWTDWRKTVQGTDPREDPEDEDNATADVKQCRTFNPSTGSFGGDTCPHSGGLDQNIFGDKTP
jgi:hypothetical protein